MQTKTKLFSAEYIKELLATYYTAHLSKKYDSIETCVRDITKEESDAFVEYVCCEFRKCDDFIPARTMSKLVNKVQLTVRYYKKDKPDKWWKSARRY